LENWLPEGKYILKSGKVFRLSEDRTELTKFNDVLYYIMEGDGDERVIVPDDQIVFDESISFSTPYVSEPIPGNGPDTTGSIPTPVGNKKKKKKKKKKMHKKVKVMKRKEPKV